MTTRVTVRHGERFFYARLSPAQVQRWNNGHLISLGLTVGTDLTVNQFEALRRCGKLEEITADTYKHAGCQSSCVRRGDATCRW